MPDIDAVTMATPPADVAQAVMYSVPDDWPSGDYVAWLEINTEGDYNGAFNDVTFPTPEGRPVGRVGDGHRLSLSRPAVGGVQRAVFARGIRDGDRGRHPTGYGSVDGLGSDAATMHAMDGSITDDPAADPGSGVDRLRFPPGASYRLQVEVRDGEFCKNQSPPGLPAELVAEPVADSKHSHQWARLRYNVPPSGLPIAKYEVRYSAAAITADDPAVLHQGSSRPGRQRGDGSLDGARVGARPAARSTWISAGSPRRRTTGSRFGRSTSATGRGRTRSPRSPRRAINYTKLSGPCFIATAAWGSALEPTVAAMRRARDQLLAEVPLFAVAADLYGRSGPAAAGVLRRSDTARVLARQLLGPLATTAEAVVPTK